MYTDLRKMKSSVLRYGKMKSNLKLKFMGIFITSGEFTAKQIISKYLRKIGYTYFVDPSVSFIRAKVNDATRLQHNLIFS